MNLYDLMGPLTVSFGLGLSCGAGSTGWQSLAAAAGVGVAVFIACRKLVSRVPCGGRANALVMLTPVAVLAATIATAWIVQSS